MGALSAKAQGLKQTITSSIKFFGSDHRIYIKAKENLALETSKEKGNSNLFKPIQCAIYPRKEM